MVTANEQYKKMIDNLVDMTRNNVSSRWLLARAVNEDENTFGINRLLAKLSDEECQLLANYVESSYLDGVFTTLHQLEWLRCCEGLEMTTKAGTIPIGEYEGLPNDYIGRYNDWEWPDE